jgi:hypothetical protein
MEPEGSSRAALEQVEALLQAADLLSQLAAMDTTVYQSSLTGQRPSNQQDTHFSDAFGLQQSLDQLQRHWKLEDTPLPKLTRSIHRLHSGLAVLKFENDQQSTDIHSLRQQLIAQHQANRTLEASVIKLYGKNEKLVAKLQKKQHDKKSLIKYVKDFVRKAQDSEQQHKELQELNVAYKLQAHEQFLAQAGRERTASVDSNFSDADALNFSATITDYDSSSVSSSTSSLLVTDEGVATVKLAAVYVTIPTHDDNVPPRCAVSEEESQDSNDTMHHSWWSNSSFVKSKSKARSDVDLLHQQQQQQLATPYTLEFPYQTKIGVKIRAVPLSDVLIPEKVTQARGLLTDAVMELDDCLPDGPVAKQLIDKKKDHASGFSMSFNFDSFLGNKGADKTLDSSRPSAVVGTAPGEVGRAFVVSGYNEFNTVRNIKPALGTRIISIDGHAIDSLWTIETLTERLATCSNKKTKVGAGAEDAAASTFSVTFRSDPLTNKHRDLLGFPKVGAALDASELHETPNTTTIESADSSSRTTEDVKANDKPSMFPFLKRGNTDALMQRDAATKMDTNHQDGNTGLDTNTVDEGEDERVDTKDRGGAMVFPFWKLGHSTTSGAPKDPLLEDENKEAPSNAEAPSANISAKTLDKKPKVWSGGFSFWKLGPSGTVTSKDDEMTIE